MNDQLKEMAEARYAETEILRTLFDLALENQWFDLQHVIQHDIAKAILADYSLHTGKGFLDPKIFYDNWEAVIEIGWKAFSNHTGIPLEQVKLRLAEISNKI
jgi:hypothetical protein